MTEPKRKTPTGSVSTKSINSSIPPVVDVAFIPQPDFVRRGAIPRIVNGEAVTKTIGGDRLAIKVDELVENTRIRRKT